MSTRISRRLIITITNFRIPVTDEERITDQSTHVTIKQQDYEYLSKYLVNNNKMAYLIISDSHEPKNSLIKVC